MSFRSKLKSSCIPMGAAIALAGASLPAVAQSGGVEVGVLNCSVSGGSGFIFGSTKQLNCVFEGPAGEDYYVGTISKYGIDIGSTSQSVIAWGVLAPTTDLSRGSLAGNYAGVAGEATVGIGVGANAMLGGSSQSITLQPLSVQAQEGLNIAAGIASMQLRSTTR